jgi:hypothetical protein
MSEYQSERQRRVEEMIEQGHSRAHAVGVSWAEQQPGYVPPPEHGVNQPSTRLSEGDG